MEQVFLKVLRLSLSAGWLVLAVAAIRALLRKAPRRVLCLLWVLAALRLVCPFSMESRLSLVPRPETVAQSVLELSAPDQTAPVPEEAGRTDSIPTAALSRVWLGGVAAMLLWALWGEWRLRRRVRVSIPWKENIRRCDEIESPFVLGLFRPRIYLPSWLDPERADYVLAHERAHIARGDHWWKPLGWLLLSVYWFHPLLWLGYLLFCRDLELACDERVARRLDREGLAAYSEALLRCSRMRRGALVLPVAFGEVGVKARVRAILRYRRPSRRLVSLTLAVILLAGALFLTEQPARATQPEETAPPEATPILEDDWKIPIKEHVASVPVSTPVPTPAPTSSPQSSSAAAAGQTSQTYESTQWPDESALQASLEEQIRETNERIAEANREAAARNTAAGSSSQTVPAPGPTSALSSGTVSNPTPLVPGANANGQVGPQTNYVGVTEYGNTTAIRLFP